MRPYLRWGALSVTLYLLRRLGIFLLSLVVASILAFVLLSLLPGDQAQTMLGVNADPEALAQLREELGTNRPILTQYTDWIGGVIRGDFGLSRSDASIGSEIVRRLQVTLPLVISGMTLATIIAVPLGTLAAMYNRRLPGTVLSVASQVGIAIPAFWMGIMLVTWIAVRWGLLPAGNFPTAGWAETASAVRSLILPVTVLGLAQGAVLMRYVRSAVLEVLNADFVRTARAKGMTLGQAMRRHGLRNAAIPVVTVLGLQLATLLIGAVVIEQVFSLPGLGRLLLDGVGNRDIPQVQGIVLVITGLVLFINFVVDVLYRAIDPRLRASA